MIFTVGVGWGGMGLGYTIRLEHAATTEWLMTVIKPLNVIRNPSIRPQVGWHFITSQPGDVLHGWPPPLCNQPVCSQGVIGVLYPWHYLSVPSPSFGTSHWVNPGRWEWASCQASFPPPPPPQHVGGLPATDSSTDYCNYSLMDSLTDQPHQNSRSGLGASSCHWQTPVTFSMLAYFLTSSPAMQIWEASYK